MVAFKKQKQKEKELFCNRDHEKQKRSIMARSSQATQHSGARRSGCSATIPSLRALVWPGVAMEKNH